MAATMRAAVYDRYGGPEVVHVEDVPRPTPRKGEVLVRVRASTVSAGDWRLRSGNVPKGFGLVMRLGFGITGPRQRILGTDYAGDVVEVGSGVTRWRVGDRVLGSKGAGCHAEYVTAPEDGPIVPIPAGLGYVEAAALPFGGVTAIRYLRDKANVKSGERVLVNGAAGSVGSAAVQVAKHLGAHVTAVCSAGNAAWVRGLGADAVIDYAKRDFTAERGAYDVVLDAVGNCTFARCRKVLAPGGRLLLVAGSLGQLVGAGLRSRRGGRRVMAGIALPNAADLEYLVDLAVAGKFDSAVEAKFGLDGAAEAHAIVDSRHKRGNVVLTP